VHDVSLRPCAAGGQARGHPYTGFVGTSVTVVSVNTGRPAPLTRRHGRIVLSAIHKRPVSASTLALSRINLEGDDQGDRTVHGGPDKALYTYPVEHLRSWAAEHPDRGEVFAPGGIGDNLTVDGWTEEEVRIGDVWRWGDAEVQVAQPRSPCYKLAARSGIPTLTRLFEETGRTGWYLRVLRPARSVPTSPPLHLELVRRSSAPLSVADATRALRPGAPLAAVERAASHPDLAESWRRALQQRLERVDRRRTA
jgi:MOSC domain-containing protein YiiM